MGTAAERRGLYGHCGGNASETRKPAENLDFRVLRRARIGARCRSGRAALTLRAAGVTVIGSNLGRAGGNHPQRRDVTWIGRVRHGGAGTW